VVGDELCRGRGVAVDRLLVSRLAGASTAR
jgi:hypothetical protein